jgi:chaperonin GroES
MKLKPLHDRVVIKPADAADKTASGIILPDSAKEKPTRGKIVAVGAGKPDKDTGKVHPLSVSVGNDVYYGKYSGTEVDVDGQKLVIVRESDLLGVAE